MMMETYAPGLNSILAPCRQCDGPVHSYGTEFRCGFCGLPVQEGPPLPPEPRRPKLPRKPVESKATATVVTLGPLGKDVEVSRGPDDSRRVPEQQRHQDRHPGRKDQRHHHSERPG